MRSGSGDCISDSGKAIQGLFSEYLAQWHCCSVCWSGWLCCVWKMKLDDLCFGFILKMPPYIQKQVPALGQALCYKLELWQRTSQARCWHSSWDLTGEELASWGVEVQGVGTACAKVLRLEGAWCLWSRKEGWSGWRTAREGDRGFEVRLDS